MNTRPQRRSPLPLTTHSALHISWWALRWWWWRGKDCVGLTGLQKCYGLSWSHHLAWGWSQWDEPWSLIAIHKWYLRRAAEPFACSQGGQLIFDWGDILPALLQSSLLPLLALQGSGICSFLQSNPLHHGVSESVSLTAGIGILAHLGTAFSFIRDADVCSSPHTVARCQGVCVAVVETSQWGVCELGCLCL